MSDTNQNVPNVRYPFMYKVSVSLFNGSFYLLAIGLLGVVASFFELLDKTYVSLFVFLVVVGFHLIVTAKSLIPVAINPKDYFTPMENREKMKKIRDQAVYDFGYTSLLSFFMFVKNYTGGIDFYLCIYVSMLLIDIFCTFHYVFYGNATRKIKLY